MRLGSHVSASIGAAALLITLTTACGGDDATVEADAPGSVLVEHSYGSTTIEGRPARIVSLDVQWTDVLLALGEPPVARVVSESQGIPEAFPWEGDLLAGSEQIDVTDAIPFERVAALQPDLIVGSFLIGSESDYQLLSDIAPTVPLLSSGQVDGWQDMAEVAGRVLRMEDEAAALGQDAAEASAALAAELPGLEGKTFALANYVPGDSIYVVADPADGSSTFFQALGLQIDPELLAEAAGTAGRAQLSLEQISLLDADLLVLLTNGADTATIAGYDNLPAVRTGAVALLDLQTIIGLNTPTPLSAPYAQEVLRPALEAAANA